MIKIAVVDLHEITRAGIRALLERSNRIRIIRETSDIRTLKPELPMLSPHVLLLDGETLRSRGVIILDELLKTTQPRTPRIVILMENGDESLALSAVRAGAFGAIHKKSPADAIINAIQQAAQGEFVLPKELLRALVDDYRSQDQPPRPSSTAIAALTDREKEVVQLVATGMGNSEIAEHFVVSESTIKTHLNRAMRKLHLTSRAAVVAFGYRSGLIGRTHR